MLALEVVCCAFLLLSFPHFVVIFCVFDPFCNFFILVCPVSFLCFGRFVVYSFLSSFLF